MAQEQYTIFSYIKIYISLTVFQKFTAYRNTVSVETLIHKCLFCVLFQLLWISLIGPYSLGG